MFFSVHARLGIVLCALRFFARALLLLVFLFPLARLSPAAAPDAEDETITLVTWNVEWFPGRFRYARGARADDHMVLVQNELRRINPDLFLAQEMRGWQAFADLCSAVPGLQPVVVSAFRGRTTGEYWPQQIAIASKRPVYAAWSEPWRRGADLDPGRGFSVAAVRVFDSFNVLLVYSVHLKSNLADSAFQSQLNYVIRDESIRQLLEHIEEMETAFWGRVAGVIVGGDFNTNHDGQFDDNVVTLLEEAGFHNTWRDTPREARQTWRGSEHHEPTTLDAFFTRGVGRPQARLVEVDEDSSDHWPVQITINLSDIGRD